MILSTIQRYVMVALGLVIVSLALYGGYQHVQHLKVAAQNVTLSKDLQVERANVKTIQKALEAKAAELEAIQVALSKHQEELEKLRKEQEATNVKLREALRSNRAWADAPIPAGVRDALRKGR